MGQLSHNIFTRENHSKYKEHPRAGYFRTVNQRTSDSIKRVLYVYGCKEMDKGATSFYHSCFGGRHLVAKKVTKTTKYSFSILSPDSSNVYHMEMWFVGASNAKLWLTPYF